MEFKPFPKIPRLLNMPMVISEKIDGINAQVYICQRFELTEEEQKYNLVDEQAIDGTDWCILAGSRTRWITPEKDNSSFAKWVKSNWAELLKLGPGQHFGEWWGNGIQRNYELKEKRFSLFNTGRWSQRPACCNVVPVLYYGQFDQKEIEKTKQDLLWTGSKAAPSYMKPEGIVIFLPKANMLFKSTFDNDDNHKGTVS